MSSSLHAVAMAALVLFVWCIEGALIQGRDINQPLQDSYDYIVVGCGISGLVVTNRLSEDPTRTVLCIEAGDAYVRHINCLLTAG